MKIIGIMTGNSLDAVDAVLTDFDNGKMTDIASVSVPYPKELTENFLKLRTKIKTKEITDLENNQFLKDVVFRYTSLVAETVNKLNISDVRHVSKLDFLAQVEKKPKHRSGAYTLVHSLSENDNKLSFSSAKALKHLSEEGRDRSIGLKKQFRERSIAAIGFHGQTLDHFPPSIAGDKKPYTIQVGDAKLLADLTQIPVAYDFRSDDIFNGGEGAPLAPVHNLHIAKNLNIDIAFCNAGNTGNISIISNNRVIGWDIGPFNHFSDYLVRKYKNESCDKDGVYGKQGNINLELLEQLFDHAAINDKGENFYLAAPPKSSDPSWYKLIGEDKYPFYDLLRTVEYLSTYSLVYNLKYIPQNFPMPVEFLIFGGGWKNPVCFNDFQNILQENAPILEKHKEVFTNIYLRFTNTPKVNWSDKYGYSGEFMEARIFADMAYSLINNEPFTFPETTNCKSPTVCGIWAYPNDNKKHSIISRAKNENK